MELEKKESTPLLLKGSNENSLKVKGEKEQEYVISQSGNIDAEASSSAVGPIDYHRRDAMPFIYDESSGIKVYKRRWYILFVFSVFATMQSYLTNVWTVIAISVHAVFGWSYAEVSLMQDWIMAFYILMFFPMTWLVNWKGIRISVIVSVLFMVIAATLRCIVLHAPAITWLSNIANMFVGAAQPIAYFLCPEISSTWFPPTERATATSMMVVTGCLGWSLCFLIGSTTVNAPKYVETSNSTLEVLTNYNSMKSEIRIIRITETGVCIVILLVILIYFPNKPPKPPSPSAGLPKYSFLQGFKTIFRFSNANFWLVTLTFTISTSIYSIWLSLVTIVFRGSQSQIMIGYLGAMGNFVSVIAAIVYGRIGDKFLGKLKPICCISITLSVLTTYWIVLLALRLVEHSRNYAEIFIAMFLQSFFITGPYGLYVEMGVEHNYPVPESITSSVMFVFYNFFPILYLFTFFIPNIGTSWMTWLLFASQLICVPLMFGYKEKYPRLSTDENDTSEIRTGQREAPTIEKVVT